MEFKYLEVSDFDKVKRFFYSDNEYSCENSFINLLIWQKSYKNMFAIDEDILIMRSCIAGKCIYRLPLGCTIDVGMKKLREISGQNYPNLWVQEGQKFAEFRSRYADHYEFCEMRDAFDYVYKREDLATLPGKNYHSKRNHISAFSRAYDWEYRSIDESHISEIKRCAEKWYEQRGINDYLGIEKQGIFIMLEHFSKLCLKGGAIYIGGEPVAFTIGSAINKNYFDVHIEKALKEYSTAYSLINNEFVKNELSEYEFINREDDMGIDGLRKAKLSYKPVKLIKKYMCVPQKEE